MKVKTLGIIRHILTLVGGGLVAKGTLDVASLDILVGSVIAIVGVVWSVKAPEKKAL